MCGRGKCGVKSSTRGYDWQHSGWVVIRCVSARPILTWIWGCMLISVCRIQYSSLDLFKPNKVLQFFKSLTGDLMTVLYILRVLLYLPNDDSYYFTCILCLQELLLIASSWTSEKSIVKLHMAVREMDSRGCPRGESINWPVLVETKTVLFWIKISFRHLSSKVFLDRH